jgi:hypothetical protein
MQQSYQCIDMIAEKVKIVHLRVNWRIEIESLRQLPQLPRGVKLGLSLFRSGRLHALKCTAKL